MRVNNLVERKTKRENARFEERMKERMKGFDMKLGMVV